MNRNRRRPEAEPDCRALAIGLLARREHSARELARKLAERGCDEAGIAEVLASLQAENLQSDARFAESHVHARVQRGHGPLRIHAELRERGVDDALVEAALEPWADEWPDIARAQWRKRFGQAPKDRAEWAKQARFLQGRGFPTELVVRILNEIEREHE